ncbi:MAG: DUF1810 domain-containing protein [Pedobacter sp.]|nr:MAG: DUF1810 domain-containing protein [Pedobacter sp.]
MEETGSLSRFIDAQQSVYEEALKEVQNGKKRSHWMWYIFPQIAGLGFTDTSKYYAIKDLKEAEEYLNHPLLGARILEISKALLKLDTRDAYSVFGSPDDLKLHSSMTLFSMVPNSDPVFHKVLHEYFNGHDSKTLQILDELGYE